MYQGGLATIKPLATDNNGIKAFFDNKTMKRKLEHLEEESSLQKQLEEKICPVCFVRLRMNEVEFNSHVNKCIDGNKSTTVKLKTEKGNMCGNSSPGKSKRQKPLTDFFSLPKVW